MNLTNRTYIGQTIDTSKAFYTLGNTHYNAISLERFSTESLTGYLKTLQCNRKSRMSFNTYNSPFENATAWAFPAVYSNEPEFPLSLSLIDENILRLRIDFGTHTQSAPVSAGKAFSDLPSLMLADTIEKLTKEVNAQITKTESGLSIETSGACFVIDYHPFTIRLYNKNGDFLTKLLTQEDSMCLQNCNPLPCSCVSDSADMRRYTAISMQAHPGESFYGCGESFTKLDKHGQRLHLWTHDPHGVETSGMYKPIPFYTSSRGYGIFAHTGAPVTVDLAHDYHESQTLFIGEDKLDLFFFVGTPKEILTGYTYLTGRPKMPPVWSFGLWMSRITYKSESEVREVAQKLQEYKIPCDVLHLDTGWFEREWCCDYQFSDTRFKDPVKLMSDLRKSGYHISLWQLPYFTPQNPLVSELVQNKLAISGRDGGLPTEDAVLDFSNPDTVQWYQKKLAGLFSQGISAIKADFGEAAPLEGVYASGHSGILEHNLYPLRYNKAVSDITYASTGNSIIWARSAWAGSQRYPLHWGGDAENTNMGMYSTLQGGLSLGMSGFSFWSHDLGGFVRKSPEELYGRWNFMGIFTSHLRAHGKPPKEPWEYSRDFLLLFRNQMNFRYSLLPYIIAQSHACAAKGHPMLRPMYFDFPEDPLCRKLDDQYMFGEDILVAPFFEDEQSQRSVYLPGGIWRDLFTGEKYTGGIHTLSDNGLRGIALVRAGAVIPRMEPALTTSDLDWKKIQYHHYTAEGRVFGRALDWPDYIPVDIDAAFLARHSKQVKLYK